MDELQAGRELDALIAEKIFGQTDFEHGEIEETATGHPACTRCNEIGYWGDNIFGDTCCIKRYSTDIAAAWDVHERLCGTRKYVGALADIAFDRVAERSTWAILRILNAETICLAARKAKGEGAAQ